MREKQSKAMQDRHERILEELLKKAGNERCADCQSRNPRWASYSLKVFLCIRCASLHRKMGTHISKVKSVTMDQWSLEQIQTMKSAGSNMEVNRIINPHPENHPLPITQDDDFALEKYIRLKWEKKAFQDEIQQSAINAAPQKSFSTPLAIADHEKYNGPMAQLDVLGFKDTQRNMNALFKTHGNLVMAIRILSNSLNAQAPVPISQDTNVTEQTELISSPSAVNEVQGYSWTQSPKSTFVGSITDTASVSSMPSTPRIPQSTNPFYTQEIKSYSTSTNPFERSSYDIPQESSLFHEYTLPRNTHPNPFTRVDGSARPLNPFTQIANVEPLMPTNSPYSRAYTTPNAFGKSLDSQSPFLSQTIQHHTFIGNQPLSAVDTNPWSTQMNN